MTALQLLLSELLREPGPDDFRRYFGWPFPKQSSKQRIATVRAALADALYRLSVPNAD